MKFLVLQIFCIFFVLNFCFCTTVDTGILEVEYTDQGTSTDFKIIKRGLTSAPTGWYAIGFSKDTSMGDDDVAICRVTSGSGTVEHYRNPGGTAAPVYLDSNNRAVGFSNIQVTFADGVLTCSFRRMKAMANIPNYFDLSTSYNLLSAFGAGSSPSYHLSNRGSTSTKINFSSDIVVTATTASTIITTLSSSNQSGGILNSAIFNVKFSDGPDYTDFTFSKSGVSADSYLAFGLSDDNKMGNDDLAVCKSGSGTVEHYRNPSGYTAPVYLESNNRVVGFSNLKVKYTNGDLTCSFRRAKTNKQRATGYFEISTSQTYYGLFSFGSFSGDSLSYHGANKAATDSKIDFTKSGTFGTKEIEKDKKIKTHGSLMVIAWMFFVAVGIHVARYNKGFLPDTKICGIQIWFHIHRPFMIFALIFTVVAFFLILDYLKWKWVENTKATEYTYAHSIMGILCVTFTFVQVLIAFFRPKPDAEFRFIFNWFHRITGNLAFVFANVALLIGVALPNVNLGEYSYANKKSGIVLGWILWWSLKDIFCEIFKCIVPEGLEILKAVLIIVHIIICLSFSLALIAIINSAT